MHAVSSVVFSADGNILASGSTDKTIRLWDVGSGQHFKTLIGHTGWVSSVVFSADGNILASGSTDDTVRLWDVKTGVLRQTLTGHTDEVTSVAFSADGSTLASGSYDDTVRLWDVGTGVLRQTLTGHTRAITSVAFSPDGNTLASAGIDNAIRLWDVGTGVLRQTLIGHTRAITSVVFSADGNTLASGSWNGEIRLWDVGTGVLRQTLTGHTTSGVNSLSFSIGGNILTSGTADGTILLWDVTPFVSHQPQPISQQPQSDLQQHPRDIVQLVYFRPSDRAVQPNIDINVDGLIKGIQQFYAEQMQRHEGKTFTFETDASGNAVVHHVDGKFTDSYYQTQTYDRVREEIEKQFDTSRHAYLVAIDVSSEQVNDGNQGHVCGAGGGRWYSTSVSEAWQRDFGGLAVIPASGACFNLGITAHELGHAFGLEHDFRDNAYLMGYGSQSKLSEDAAEWLSVHRFFNTDQTGFNQDPTLEIRSDRASQLQFQVTDVDGLHQAQLLIPTTPNDPAPGLKLHSVQTLNSKTSATVEFAVSELTGSPEVTLQVIDVNGNITKQTFPVEVDNVTQIPDVSVGEDVVTVSLSSSSVLPVSVGEHLTLSVRIADGVDIAGYQVEVDYDTSALRYISSTNAEYLPADAFVVPALVNRNRVTLAATSLQNSSRGDGVLATLTFEVIVPTAAMPVLSDAKLTDSDANFLGIRIENEEAVTPVQPPADVNRDGVVNVLDLITIVSRFDQTGANSADVNGDGIVNLLDLVLVAGALGDGAAAAPTLESLELEGLTAAEIQDLLKRVHQLALTDTAYLRGIVVLEQLLSALIPKETALLPNYPNPFNPETWIPYQLTKPAEVTLRIYAADGKLVRRLALGHQAAGIYESRSRAAYWDGRNEQGEPVASGVYFYTLTAGDFAATRKMLIRK